MEQEKLQGLWVFAFGALTPTCLDMLDDGGDVAPLAKTDKTSASPSHKRHSLHKCPKSSTSSSEKKKLTVHTFSLNNCSCGENNLTTSNESPDSNSHVEHTLDKARNVPTFKHH